MDKRDLKQIIDDFFGDSLQPVVKDGLADSLWPDVDYAIESAMDKGYVQGVQEGMGF